MFDSWICRNYVPTGVNIGDKMLCIGIGYLISALD